MKNFRINFQEDEREDILRVLNESNDIIIDNIGPLSVGITIERDDADQFYQELLQKIDHELYHQKNSNMF